MSVLINKHTHALLGGVGRQEGHPACKKTGCWFVGCDDLSGASHVLEFQLSSITTSVILSSNKIQNGDITVPANPGPPGKWPLKRRERLSGEVEELVEIVRGRR